MILARKENNNNKKGNKKAETDFSLLALPSTELNIFWELDLNVKR